MNAMTINNKIKYFKLYLSVLFVFSLFYAELNAQPSSSSYIPEWFHGNYSPAGTSSSGTAVAGDANHIYVAGFFTGSGNNFCSSCFPSNNCTVSNCGSLYSALATSSNYTDAFLAKYCKTDGGLQWVKRISGGTVNPGHVNGMDVTIDGSGNVIVTGYFESASLLVDGSSVALNNVNTAGDRDIFVMKFSASGGYTSGDGITIGGATEDNVYSILIYNTDIYIGGSYTDDLSNVIGSSGSPPLAHTGSGKDIFVIKIPSSFTSPCGISRGGSGEDEAYDIAADATGNLFVTGYFSGADGDFSSLPYHNNKDMFLWKINNSPSAPTCSLAWSSTLTTIFGGAGDDYGKSVVVNGSEIYITGNYHSPAFINNTSVSVPSTFGGSDVFISKYLASNFSHAWTNNMGGTLNDMSVEVCLGGNGVIVVGNIIGQVAMYSSSSVPFANFEIGSLALPLCDGNRATNNTNSFIITFDGGGHSQSPTNVFSKGIFSSTGDFTIKSAIVSTELYFTGSYDGLFDSKMGSAQPCSLACGTSCTSPLDAEIVCKINSVTNCTTNPLLTVYCAPCCPPNPQFAALQTSICTGDQVQFFDASTNGGGTPINAWSWIFPGGTPVASNQQHPIVTYNTPGVYDVTLTVGAGCLNTSASSSYTLSTISSFNCCTDVITRTAYITVTDCGTPLPTPTTYIPNIPTTTYVPASCAICPCTSCPPSTWATHITTYQDRDLPCDSCIQPFELTPDKKYMLSAWVKEKNPCTLPVCHGAILVAFPETTAPVQSYHPSGEIIDGWQRIEGVFLVPHDATSIQIFLTNTSANSADDIYFDDIRVHPFDANMKSYVYDPVSLKLVSELDENNYATFYEYDEEGKLARVKKETERGIATIKESRVNTKKN